MHKISEPVYSVTPKRWTLFWTITKKKKRRKKKKKKKKIILYDDAGPCFILSYGSNTDKKNKRLHWSWKLYHDEVSGNQIKMPKLSIHNDLYKTELNTRWKTTISLWNTFSLLYWNYKTENDISLHRTTKNSVTFIHTILSWITHIKSCKFKLYSLVTYICINKLISYQLMRATEIFHPSHSWTFTPIQFPDWGSWREDYGATKLMYSPLPIGPMGMGGMGAPCLML